MTMKTIKTKVEARDGRQNIAAFEARRHGVNSVMVRLQRGVGGISSVIVIPSPSRKSSQ
jgi:hypothetical protein